MNDPLGLQPQKTVESTRASTPSWRRINATDLSVSESDLELKLSTKDPLALASMKNVAKREM
jgi:hypothetical protein